MCVAVKNQRHRVSIDWLLEPARSQKRIDLERLSLNGRLDRRVVQQRDHMRRAQSCQRRVELQRLVDRLADELLDDPFSPRSERALTEAAAEPLHAGDADAVDLGRVAVEYDDAGVGDNLTDLLF